MKEFMNLDKIISRYIFTSLLAGSITISVGLLSYFHFVAAKNFIPSNDGTDWAEFGSYFGGFIGPILSFIALFLIAVTLLLQLNEIQESRKVNELQNELVQIQMNQIKIERLESNANVYKKNVDTYLSSAFRPLENYQLSEVITMLSTRLEMAAMTTNNLSLAEAIEVQAKGADFLKVKLIEPSLVSRILAISTLPIFSGALEDYRKSIIKIVELDNVTDADEKKQILRNKLKPYKTIAMDINVMGLMPKTAAEDWFFNADGVLRSKPKVRDKPL